MDYRRMARALGDGVPGRALRARLADPGPPLARPAGPRRQDDADPLLRPVARRRTAALRLRSRAARRLLAPANGVHRRRRFRAPARAGGAVVPRLPLWPARMALARRDAHHARRAVPGGAAMKKGGHSREWPPSL